MSETIGFDEQTRSLYSIENFKEREKHTCLIHLYNYWASAPLGAHGLPCQDAFQPKRDLQADVAARVSWIDTRPDDPSQYIIREHTPNPLPGFGIERSNKTLCDWPNFDMHTTACAVEYLFCKNERIAMYHEIEQIIGGLKRHYTRIMLPVASDTGDVEQIFYATRQVAPNKRVSFKAVEQI